MAILLLGRTSIPFLYHLPVTFSSDTSHLNTACSEAFTVRSAMSCRTSSCFSGGEVGEGGRWSCHDSSQPHIFTSVHYVPSTVPDTGDTAGNKPETTHWPHGATIIVGRQTVNRKARRHITRGSEEARGRQGRDRGRMQKSSPGRGNSTCKGPMK